MIEKVKKRKVSPTDSNMTAAVADRNEDTKYMFKGKVTKKDFSQKYLKGSWPRVADIKYNHIKSKTRTNFDFKKSQALTQP